MDKFTEGLAEGVRRFTMAGLGAVSITVEKSKEIINQLIARGEVTAADGQTVCDDLQKKLTGQFEAFSKKLKADYENASFDALLKKCDALSPEQKELLVSRLTSAPQSAADSDETVECESDKSVSNADFETINPTETIYTPCEAEEPIPNDVVPPEIIENDVNPQDDEASHSSPDSEN